MKSVHRESWIDSLRGVAIIAVIIDHAWFLFFPSMPLVLWWKHTYLSIPWFLCLSGIVNTLSFSRHDGHGSTGAFLASAIRFWKKRIPPVVAAYVAGTGIVFFLSPPPIREKAALMEYILRFSLQPSYYFVNLLLQLYVIFPLLYLLLRVADRNVWKHAVLFVAMTATAAGLVNYGYPAWPFAPAGRILGGLYLPVFFGGMLVAKWRLYERGVVYLIAVIVFILFEGALIYQQGGFIQLLPTPPFVMWALAGLGTAIAFGAVTRPPAVVTWPLRLIGRHSYAIFLYHFFILTWLAERYVYHAEWFLLGSILSIGIPLLLAVGYEYAKRAILWTNANDRS